MQKISPCLWFDGQAEEAAKFYTSIFKNSRIGTKVPYTESSAKASGQPKGTVMTVEFTIENFSILGLNGGPHFKFTPAMSLFVHCESEQEIDQLWKKLSQDGTVRMGLDAYPWAQKYGWTADRFGVEWQLMITPGKQKIVPAFLFVDKLFGKGQEAVAYYVSQFPQSSVTNMVKDEATNTIAHCAFELDGQEFVLMEGAGEHGFTFNEAFSLMVSCSTQKEIDKYWENLSQGGSTQPCGWLKDKYGVAWQIVPDLIAQAMQKPENLEPVMAAVMQMKKLDLSKINQAMRL